jgi:hypothetical protein
MTENVVVELRHVQTREPPEGSILRRQHWMRGWSWVWYQKRRYQVFGGVRVVEFIDLDCPILTRSEIYKEFEKAGW